jgi:hypothetical protein
MTENREVLLRLAQFEAAESADAAAAAPPLPAAPVAANLPDGDDEQPDSERGGKDEERVGQPGAPGLQDHPEDDNPGQDSEQSVK